MRRIAFILGAVAMLLAAGDDLASTTWRTWRWWRTRRWWHWRRQLPRWRSVRTIRRWSCWSIHWYRYRTWGWKRAAERATDPTQPREDRRSTTPQRGPGEQQRVGSMPAEQWAEFRSPLLAEGPLPRLVQRRGCWPGGWVAGRSGVTVGSGSWWVSSFWLSWRRRHWATGCRGRR